MFIKFIQPALAAYPTQARIMPVVNLKTLVDIKLLLRAEEMVDHGLCGHIHPSVLDVPASAQDQLKEVLNPP